MNTRDYTNDIESIKGLNFDLQVFGEGDPPPTFEFMDPTTKAKINIPEKIGEVNLRSLIEGVIVKSKTDAKSAYEKELNPILEEVKKYREDNQTLSKMLEDIENAKLTEGERNKKEKEKFEKDSKALIDKAIADGNRYKSLFIDNVEQSAIITAFGSRTDVNRPEQAYKLMKAEFPVEVQEKEENGRLNHRVVVKLPNSTGEYEELDPKGAVERWLAMPEHSHFLKSNLVPGAGSSSSGASRSANGSLVYKRSQMNDTKIRAEYTSKQKAGEPVQLVDG